MNCASPFPASLIPVPARSKCRPTKQFDRRRAVRTYLRRAPTPPRRESLSEPVFSFRRLIPAPSLKRKPSVTIAALDLSLEVAANGAPYHQAICLDGICAPRLLKAGKQPCLNVLVSQPTSNLWCRKTFGTFAPCERAVGRDGRPLFSVMPG